MKRLSAVELALTLNRAPAFLKRMRALPPPHDILTVIQIAASCPETTESVAAQTNAPKNVLKAASTYYLRKTLFFSNASLYRNLGLPDGAPHDQMQLHMHWLMRWLHPDHNRDKSAGALFCKVDHAWRELKDRESAQPRPTMKVAKPTFSIDRPRRGGRRVWIGVPLPDSINVSSDKVSVNTSASATASASVKQALKLSNWIKAIALATLMIVVPSPSQVFVSRSTPVTVAREDGQGNSHSPYELRRALYLPGEER